jgi:putative phosphoesterase
MKIAFLSDVHANLPALDAGVAAARERGAERIVVAGDVVGDGPFPAESIARLRDDHPCDVIRGNVDREVARLARRKGPKALRRRAAKNGKKANRAWTVLALSAADLDWLENLPPTLDLDVEGVGILVVHGSPRSDREYIYPSLTPAGLERILHDRDGPRPRLLVSGHSHVPFASHVNGTLVINCGSIGRPADCDPRGSFALVEIGDDSVEGEIVRFDYPVEEVVRALERLDVPGVEAEEFRQGVKELKSGSRSAEK